MTNGENREAGQLGFVSVWSLAAGGMVGGGIYIALGVVIAVSGQWAWASFVIAGAVATTAAFSYVHLSNEFEEGGGAFEFLREIDHEGLAGSLSWVLVIGYVLTMAVYAFAFGHYLSHAFDLGTWVTRGFAVGIMFALVVLNLQGLGSTKMVEMVTVVENLVALIALGVWGVLAWDPVKLVAGIEPRSPWTAVIGA
ncbi:MAG: amino acid permease, partial [Thermoanaerobaculia bacterium]|nr:amino acid permease [Thermoanaerobaculia bacterium]